MSDNLSFFATCPKGLELLLKDELITLGAFDVKEKLAGVAFTGSLKIAYKICLWSRLANHILYKIGQFPCETNELLYSGVQQIAWHDHLTPRHTLSVKYVSHTAVINHSLFGAQKVKDAIVDQLRDKFGERPNVAREAADVVVHVYNYRDVATISIDLSGESLHKRGYRLSQGLAPLKENLAAAMLIRAGWPSISKEKGGLVDPMCGSGTLLIEGALMAANIAPGLTREYFGFIGWKQHQPVVWAALREEAQLAKAQGLKHLPKIIGYDANPAVITDAFDNISRAGLSGKVHVEKRSLDLLSRPSNIPTGLIITNPPYGERLGDFEALQQLYAELGLQFKREFEGWKAALLTGNPELGKTMGLRAKKYYALFNGTIPCQLLLFDIEQTKFIDNSIENQNARLVQNAVLQLDDTKTKEIDMFVNRIKKNIKHRQKWAQREGISCYRIYDTDLPEYAFTIDIYDHRVLVKEYQAPKSIDTEKALQRQQAVLACLPATLNIAAQNIFYQHENTKRRTGFALATEFNIAEDDIRFVTNFKDKYLDLSLRNLRSFIKKNAKNKALLTMNDFNGSIALNALFGQVGSIRAIVDDVGDMALLQQNFALNNCTPADKCRFVAFDEWYKRDKQKYDLIYAELTQVEDMQELLYTLTKRLYPELAKN